MTNGYTKGQAVVEKVQEFPFGVRVFVGDVEVLKQDAVAFATGQENRQDNELAIGFPADQRERIATFIKEQDANAELFAEAFNVANETGRTPKQLADDREELFNALEQLRGHCNDRAWAGAAKRAAVVADLVIADALLAKLKKGGAP